MHPLLCKPLRSFCATAIICLFTALSAQAKEFSGGQPVSPAPQANTLKQGLKVDYFFQYFDHIRQLDGRSGGKPGTPIEKLNHVSFEDGKVLTTDKPMGVGAHIRGLIHLDKVGDYVFLLQSNDGVKFSIGDIHRADAFATRIRLSKTMDTMLIGAFAGSNRSP